MVDKVADAINKIKTNERIGRLECILESTKLTKLILKVMKEEKYIEDFEEFTDNKFKKIRVKLLNKINNIGVIKPRFAVSANEIIKYEMQYIPSKDFGTLIISTPQGLMTNREAKAKNIGGRLIAYIY
ncbi:MAG: 30S ribosomal protein S8 [Candidatus Marsarchaeota archaeon]|jgi:small subunit ribosomal protein S8|nr:30S ribosomal protein S8 [Candidatus Marsarchaeota archaeon]